MKNSFIGYPAAVLLLMGFLYVVVDEASITGYAISDVQDVISNLDDLVGAYNEVETNPLILQVLGDEVVNVSLEMNNGSIVSIVVKMEDGKIESFGDISDEVTLEVNSDEDTINSIIQSDNPLTEFNTALESKDIDYNAIKISTKIKAAVGSSALSTFGSNDLEDNTEKEDDIGKALEALKTSGQSLAVLERGSTTEQKSLELRQQAAQTNVDVISEMLTPSEQGIAKLGWVLFYVFLGFIVLSIAGRVAFKGLWSLYKSTKEPKKKPVKKLVLPPIPEMPKVQKPLPPIPFQTIPQQPQKAVKPIPKIEPKPKNATEPVPKEILDSVAKLKILVEQKKRLKSKKGLTAIKSEIERLKEIVEIEKAERDIFQRIEAIKNS